MQPGLAVYEARIQHLCSQHDVLAAVEQVKSMQVGRGRGAGDGAAAGPTLAWANNRLCPQRAGT